MTRPHLTYPVAGILALAAALPMLVPSMFLDLRVTPAANARPSGAIVVASLSGAAPAPAAPPSGRAPAPGDDRWWRGQAARALTTISFTSAPKSPPLPPAPPPTAPPPADRSEPSARPIELVPVAPSELRLTAQVPVRIRRWEPLILKAARKHDVDPTLIAAVMMTESSGNAQAVSAKGAIGLMQVLDGPTDPEANIEAGVGLLSSHLRRFGSIDLALAAYNAGVGSVLEHGGVPPFQETRDHITRTLASYTAWRAA